MSHLSIGAICVFLIDLNMFLVLLMVNISSQQHQNILYPLHFDTLPQTKANCTTSLYIFHIAQAHSAVNLKYKETVSCCAIMVGCIKISAHHVADLKLRGTSSLLEIIAKWADISAQATVLSLPPQRELLPLLHHHPPPTRYCTVKEWLLQSEDF